MNTPIAIGTARGVPGEIVYGTFEGVALPTGGSDDFAIILAQGKADGPTLWVTGSIHGNEYSGMAVIHHLLGPGGTYFPIDNLRGTVVMIPTLSPAGLRTEARSPYYNRGADPNRMFPAPERPGQDARDDDQAPSTLEKAYARLFEQIERNGDLLIDLHNAVLGSIGFTFRDPIYYSGEAEKNGSQKLLKRNDEMMEAFGFPIINEFPSAQYLKKNLHRSVSGAVLNRLRRPAFTVELGGYLHVDYAIRNAAAVGVHNVMRWAGMLPGSPEAMPTIPRPQVDYPVRRMMHPRTPQSGIIKHLVDTGDVVRKGDAVARLVDIYGRPIGPDNGLLRTEHDGYVVGRMQGEVYYENEPVLWMAVRDNSELLLPFPSDY